jgi:hypothetical protein
VAILINVEGLATLAPLPVTILFFRAVGMMASEDGYGEGDCLLQSRIICPFFLQISYKLDVRTLEYFVSTR